ncbi:glycosyltransferase [Aquincola sp. MAHUQ-54]|uniref:Glycosyltransferase n=1 Tax=Aquincola agrisoli TaxID=3119538 RepID=A0AAW9Q9P0_9BURK
MTERHRPRRLRVLTWHVHGNYLYYLSQAPHDFYLATLPGHPPGHAGKVGVLPWGANVHEVPADALHGHAFDCVLYQHERHWHDDRLHRLTAAQRALPALYVEHDPPQGHPTDTRHPAADGGAHIVHVTPFNALMWDNGEAPVSIVDHGVLLPADACYSGVRPEGIVVVNHLQQRGRRLGADVFERVRSRVPLQLVGMDSARMGGLGEVSNLALPAAMGEYRFFFNPIRYTSLGLAVVEAMMVGLPIVGLATTELVTVVRNGVNGYLDTRIDRLVEVMRMLVDQPETARRWGAAARETALGRFGIRRFADDWDRVLTAVCAGVPVPRAAH